MQPIQTVMYRTTSVSSKSYNAEQNRQEIAESSTTSKVRSSARVAAVENIWAVLGSRYGHTWTTKQDADDQIAMNDWCDAVAGLHFSDIKAGLEKTKTDLRFRSFPPNSMEFRALCISETSEQEILYKQVVNWKDLDQEEKTREGLFIVQNIEMFEFRRSSEKVMKQIFMRAYNKLQDHRKKGLELPEFLLEIEYEVPPPMPIEKRRSFLADLMKTVDNPQGA